MGEQGIGQVRQALLVLTEANGIFTLALQQMAKSQEALNRLLNDIWRTIYEREGCPYGQNYEDMCRWVRDQNEE